MTQQTNALRLADELHAAVQKWPQMSRRGYCSEFDQFVDAAAIELRRLDAVEVENKRLKDRLDFHLERSAQRGQRLWIWAHEELSEPLKTRYFNIVANGTADVMEQPVYAQQFNMMRHRAESAEAERDQLRAHNDALRSELSILTLAHDQLRAQVERLQGGESVAVIGPPNKQCHTCGFVGPEDVVMGCPKCGFDDMRTIRSTAGFLPDWEFDVHDDDDGLTWLNIYPPHGAVAAFSVQTKRRDGQTTIAAEVLRKFVKAIKAAQLQANSPFCPGCGSTECAQPAAPALVPWQPIETAPKDGRTLLLGGINSCGKWRTMRGQWMSQDYIDQNWEDPDAGEPGWFETCVESEEVPNCWPIAPTRWMPLPPAPVGIGQPVGGEKNHGL